MKSRIGNTIIIALLLSGCVEHYEANLSDDTKYTRENSPVKDTVYSEAVIKSLKAQVLDNMNLYATMTPAKLEHSLPPFVMDWMLQQFPDMNKKQVIARLIENTKKQRLDLNRDMQRLRVTMKQEVKDSIRMFTVNDTLLFANLELSSYYIRNGKKSEALSEIISISADSGKHWQFTDKDGCREALEVQFGKEVSSIIMNK